MQIVFKSIHVLLTHLVSSTEPTFQVSAIMNSASSAPNDAAAKGPLDCNQKVPKRESAAKKDEVHFVFCVHFFETPAPAYLL